MIISFRQIALASALLTATVTSNTMADRFSYWGGGSSYNIGETAYYNGNSGLSGTARNIGNTTYYNYNNGVSGTARNIGNTT